MRIRSFTLSRHEIATLSDLAAVHTDIALFTIEQRPDGHGGAITRVVMPEGVALHLGRAQDAPKWIVEIEERL